MTNIYPRLDEIAPSAPPDTGWRLGEISSIKEQFRKDAESRNRTRRKYKRAQTAFVSACTVASTGAALCSAGSLICLSTGVGVVAAVPLGATALGLGVLSGSGGIILKHLSKKLAKHESLETLSRNRGDAVSALTSQALMDGCVSNEEFKLILQERESYLKSVAQIRARARVELIDIEGLKNEMLAQGRKDALREIMKK